MGKDKGNEREKGKRRKEINGKRNWKNDWKKKRDKRKK